MITEFRCNECRNISFSAMDDSHDSCPYCGYYDEGSTLAISTDHLIDEQKRRPQILEDSMSSKLRPPSHSTIQPTIQTHASTSVTLTSHITSQGKRRTYQW